MTVDPLPAEGQDAEELEHTAPAFEITRASAEGGHGDAAATEGVAGATTEGSGALAWTGVVLGAVGLVAGGTARVEPEVGVTANRPGRWGRAFRLAATGLVVVCAVVVGAGPAAAHAQLIGTDPEDGAVLEDAPEAVTLSFNEPVRLTDREITVHDAGGRAVGSGATSTGTDVVVDLPADLGRGTYVVAWFVLSGDGHPISGSLTFSVGERGSTVADPPRAPTSSKVVTMCLGVLGAVMYVGLLVATGLAAFVALVLPGSFAGERVRRRVRDLARVAAGTAAAAAVLLVPMSAAYAQGEEVTALVTGFDPALVVDELVSTLLLLAGLAVVVVTLTDTRPRDPASRRLLVGGAAVAAVSPALVGHTRSYEPTPLLLVADAVHLLAGAAWLGGLLGMVLALPSLSGRERLAAQTLARFSVLAGGLLTAVAAAGAVLGWRILGSWSGFVDTRYGVLLLVKIGLALVVAGIGSWNRFVLLPRVEAAAVFADRSRSAGAVTRTMAGEVTVIVLLLGVTGFLVTQSPHPVPVGVPPGRTGIEQEPLGDLEVYAGRTPRRQGRNTLLVAVDPDQHEEQVVARLLALGVERELRPLVGRPGPGQRVQVEHGSGLAVEAGDVAAGPEVGVDADRPAVVVADPIVPRTTWSPFPPSRGRRTRR